jgi:CubicO group peptidase (beta-lactamase class C family)
MTLRIGLSAAAAAMLATTLPAQTRDTTVATAIDRVFDSYRGTEGPGCAVGVARNGQVVHTRGYGMANLETRTPISPSSIFHVASVSKQFTAMAILLLEKDGKLSLDDDIRKYLPEIPDYGTKITIRHLLTHTSGLRDQWDLLIMARGRFEENRVTEADVMDIVPRQKAPNFSPGSEYLYSNTGYTLAAVIVKRVSGKSLRDFANDRIFVPLGMADTHFHDDYTMVVPGRTWAYAPRGPGAGFRNSIPNYDTYGATSLFTTVGDLLKWQANFDSMKVGDAKLFAAMTTRGRLVNGDSIAYGLGVGIETYRGAAFVEHGGSDAGYRSHLIKFPSLKLDIAIACNVSTAVPGTLARRIADAIDASALAAVTPEVMPQGISVAAPDLEKRLGIYAAPQMLQVATVTMREGRLIWDGNAARQLIPLGEERFRLANQPFELRFLPDGNLESYTLSGRRWIRYEKKPAARTGRAAMEEYAGEYFSEELNATYRVVANDSAVAIHIGTAAPIQARTLFEDAFAARNYNILFTRTGRRVTGFRVTSSRVRDVAFVRVR